MFFGNRRKLSLDIEDRGFDLLLGDGGFYRSYLFFFVSFNLRFLLFRDVRMF